MDGGSIRAPNGAVYGLNGEWEVENVGVAPDIEVEFDPAAWRQGRDRSSKKRSNGCWTNCKKNPPKEYKRPALSGLSQRNAAWAGRSSAVIGSQRSDHEQESLSHWYFALYCRSSRLSHKRTSRCLFRQPTMNKNEIVFVYRRRSVAGFARRRECRAPDERRRQRNESDLFAGRELDRFYRRIRRQRGRLRHSGDRRRAEADHISPGRRSGHRLDAGRQIGVVSFTRAAGMPVPKMYTMPVTGGGLPTELPFPMAGGGASFSPDGSRIAYMPLGAGFRAMEKISRRANDENLDRESERFVRRRNPAPEFQRLLADLDGRQDLFSLRPQRRKRRRFIRSTRTRKKSTQAVANNGLDLKTASAGPDAIVYEQFGSINIFDPSSGKASQRQHHAERRFAAGSPALRASRAARSRTSRFRRPAPAPFSKRAARSSAFRPKRETPEI